MVRHFNSAVGNSQDPPRLGAGPGVDGQRRTGPDLLHLLALPCGGRGHGTRGCSRASEARACARLQDNTVPPRGKGAAAWKADTRGQKVGPFETGLPPAGLPVVDTERPRPTEAGLAPGPHPKVPRKGKERDGGNAGSRSGASPVRRLTARSRSINSRFPSGKERGCTDDRAGPPDVSFALCQHPTDLGRCRYRARPALHRIAPSFHQLGAHRERGGDGE